MITANPYDNNYYFTDLASTNGSRKQYTTGDGNSQRQGNSVALLRRYQFYYEARLQEIINQLEQQMKLRQAEYKECEELSRQTGRLCCRWRRLTSLVVEALIELDTEINNEENDLAILSDSIRETQQNIHDLQEERTAIANFNDALEQFINDSVSFNQQNMMAQFPGENNSQLAFLDPNDHQFYS